MTERATDRQAVHDVMHRYALAIDTKDWVGLAAVLDDRIRADFRSFGVRQVFEGAGADWADQIRTSIAGMDATQHLMANHLYSIAGDRATGTSYIQALHLCRNDWGGDRYTIGGHYDVEMARRGDGWRIAFYRLNVAWHQGDRHVLRAAIRKTRSA